MEVIHRESQRLQDIAVCARSKHLLDLLPGAQASHLEPHQNFDVFTEV